MEKKVTKKDFYNQIIAVFEGGALDGVTVEDVVAFCNKEIDALDRKATKAKETAAKKKSETDELTELIETVLTDELATIAEITAKVTPLDAEATVSKVTYRLNKLVKLDKAVKEEITIPATETSKARKCQAYKRA